MRRVILLAVMAALLQGCPSVPEEHGPYLLSLPPDTEKPGLIHERFVALDKETAGALYYLDSRQERLPSGQVRVVVILENALEDDAWFDWKAVFYDDEGFHLEETEWHADHFPVRETKSITAQSIRTDVEKFTFMFRAAPR
jgi:hypothetical protein